MLPFKSTILQEKSQLQELNHRLESYLSRVRLLEQENQSLVTEIQHLRSEGRTEDRNVYVDEINRTRRELEELMFEKSKAEIQRRSLWHEIQELQTIRTTDQAALKNIGQQLDDYEKALQETETTNASLEGYILELRAECQILEEQHGRAKRGLREKLRQAPQVPVARGYHAAPLTEEHFEHHALAVSALWEESFEIYKSKIEELETAVQKDRERGEELNEERVLVIKEIEALKKELEDQFNLQNQLEEVFLTFQQKHDLDMEEYQVAIDLLEDEKQHLVSTIALNLKEQQQLMQVKMGLSLELSTYRTLLEGEHAKYQEIQQNLRKPKQGMETRSHSYRIAVQPAPATLEGRKWKLTNINVPSSFRKVITKKGITPEPGQSRILARKTMNGSVSDEDLLYTEDTVSSSARSIMADRGGARVTPAPSALDSRMKETAAEDQVFPERIGRKSKTLLAGAELVSEAAICKPKVVVSESDSEEKRDVSYHEESSVKSQSSNESAQPFGVAQDYDFNRRSTGASNVEEYKREPSKDVTTVKYASKVDLINTGPPMSPDRYVYTTDPEASAELTKCFNSDNIRERAKEEPAMGTVEEIWAKANAGESNGHQGTVVSKEEILTNNMRIEDTIETVTDTTDLEKIKVLPDPPITYQIEEKEILDDGRTKREIVIQSRREETVDAADRSTLEDMLNMDGKAPELQLKGALEHLTGSGSEGLLGGLLSLGIQGRKAPGKVSVSVEVDEQFGEIDDFSAPEDTIPLSLGTQASGHEGKDDRDEEVLNITMTAAEFRKTMLSNTEPFLQKVAESSLGSSSPNEKAPEMAREEAEWFGANETKMTLHRFQGDGDAENVQQTKVTLLDSLSKELSAPCLIEESVKVPQGVQASIVELLNEEAEDPQLKLKGTLQQLKGAVPESLRDELSILTRDAPEGSDSVSINIKNFQQSSQGGVVTIEAEVNVSQTLDPEDFYSMEEYIGGEENKDEIGSGLKFLSTQGKVQELLSGRGLKTVDTLHDGGGINVKVRGVNEPLVAFSETSERGVEDIGYTGCHDLAGGVAVHDMTESSEVEGYPSDRSTWFQKAAGKMEEEFFRRTSDPADPSETFRMDINRIMTVRTTGGDHEEGVTLVAQHQEIPERTDGRRPEGNRYWYEEWESGISDAVEEENLQASDPELMQHTASPNHLTKSRIIAPEGITQVIHSEKKVVLTYFDEGQSDDLPQSADGQ
ncbi:synemin [Scyliorhinus canicula]|uniref:synemin n=1 Tax=Scyliorhinus canicula TaxID=7830 RepID=UPI0018F7CD90|nr:synemin [Scyliorhinus canicula]